MTRWDSSRCGRGHRYCLPRWPGMDRVYDGNATRILLATRGLKPPSRQERTGSRRLPRNTVTCRCCGTLRTSHHLSRRHACTWHNLHWPPMGMRRVGLRAPSWQSMKPNASCSCLVLLSHQGWKSRGQQETAPADHPMVDGESVQQDGVVWNAE